MSAIAGLSGSVFIQVSFDQVYELKSRFSSRELKYLQKENGTYAWKRGLR